MEQEKIQVYISIDKNNIVTKIFSSVFEEPSKTDVFICEGLGDEYSHPHLKYKLLDENMCHNYKIVGTKLTERTEEEKQIEIAERPKPTDLQTENKVLKAQIQALTDNQEFLSDCLAEMAAQIYQ